MKYIETETKNCNEQKVVRYVQFRTYIHMILDSGLQNSMDRTVQLEQSTFEYVSREYCCTSKFTDLKSEELTDQPLTQPTSSSILAKDERTVVD